MTYLLIITLAPSPILSQITHIDIISLGVDAVLSHGQDTRTFEIVSKENYKYELYQLKRLQYFEQFKLKLKALVYD